MSKQNYISRHYGRGITARSLPIQFSSRTDRLVSRDEILTIIKDRYSLYSRVYSKRISSLLEYEEWIINKYRGYFLLKFDINCKIHYYYDEF